MMSTMDQVRTESSEAARRAVAALRELADRLEAGYISIDAVRDVNRALSSLEDDDYDTDAGRALAILRGR